MREWSASQKSDGVLEGMADVFMNPVMPDFFDEPIFFHGLDRLLVNSGNQQDGSVALRHERLPQARAGRLRQWLERVASEESEFSVV